MQQPVDHDMTIPSFAPARVVRLKTLEEIAQAKSPEDSQLQAALSAVAQASELMDRMQQRCAEIERQAEEYVYQCRDDVTKAREQINQLEQKLRQADDQAKSFQMQSKGQVLRVRELEVTNRELMQRVEASEAALKERSEAVSTLQTAINDHLDAGLRRIDSLGGLGLSLISGSAAA